MSVGKLTDQEFECLDYLTSSILATPNKALDHCDDLIRQGGPEWWVDLIQVFKIRLNRDPLNKDRLEEIGHELKAYPDDEVQTLGKILLCHVYG